MPQDPRTRRPVPSSPPVAAPLSPLVPEAGLDDGGAGLAGLAGLAGFGALCRPDRLAPIGVVERVAIDVNVDGSAVASRWTVRFRNTTAQQLEAFYVCPLPIGSAVVAATARFGDRVVRAELAERDTARRVFDAAVAAGIRTALVEADRAEVFTFTLGRLAPGEHPEITVELVASLDVDLGVASLRLPLVVAPRYSPQAPPLHGDGAHGTVLDPDASRLEAPRTGDPAQMVPVEVALRWSGPDATPTCNAVGAVWHRDGGGWRMAWAGVADRDVVVRAPATALERAICFPDGLGGQLVRVDLVGPEAPATAGRDVVVLIDRSGSMGGWKMVAARQLAARLVDGLGPDDRVMVIGFDDRMERSNDTLVAVDAPQRRRIGRFIEGLDGRGGTELAAAIVEGCRRLHHGAPPTHPDTAGFEGRDRVLVLVTDAQVSDEAHSANTLAAELGDAQVYVIGIDQAVNAGLCRNLATVGGGRFELVTDPAELGRAGDRIVARVGRPSVRAVAATVARSDPARLPGGRRVLPAAAVDLFHGAMATLWLPVAGEQVGATVQLEGSAAGRPWTRALIVEPAGDAALQAAVWAGHELAALERDDEQGSIDAAARATNLSLASGVLCRFTAFIAVDHAGTRLAGPTGSVVQPLAEPAGWLLQAAGRSMPAARPAPMGGTAKRRSRHDGAGAPAALAGPFAAPAPVAAPMMQAASTFVGADVGNAAIGSGLLRRIAAVADHVEADPFGAGLVALTELLDDLATLDLPAAVAPIVELLQQLQQTLRDHSAPANHLSDLRVALATIP